MLPIRKGYRVDSKDNVRASEIIDLESKGIIEVIKKSYKKCTHCGHIIYLESLPEDQIYYCPGCERRVRKTNFNDESLVINQIHSNKILSCIEEKLKPLNFTRLDSYRCFVSATEKPVYIVISPISTCTALLSKNGGDDCIFVTLDHEFINAKPLDQWIPRTFDFTDFLNMNESAISELVESTSVYLDSSKRYDKGLDVLLAKSPTYFEQTFVPFFIDELKKKDRELKRYLLYLKSNETSLINSKTIVLGGPGNPDFYLLNLNKYLSDGLTPERYGEVKRYCKSQFTISDYGKILVHSNEGKNLIIISTNDIQKEVWIKIIESHNNQGYYKNVILDSDLILTLVNVLKIDLDRLHQT